VVADKPVPWEIEVNQRVQRVIVAAARDSGATMLRDQAVWTRAVLKLQPMNADG
jgi:hypothetical protein